MSEALLAALTAAVGAGHMLLEPELRAGYEHDFVQLHHAGAHTSAELAELFGVARSTVYRAIERQRIAAKAVIAESSARR